MRLGVLVAMTVMLAGCGGETADRAAGPGRPPDEAAAVADRVAPSLVRVRYTVCYDKGEAPRAGGWIKPACPVRDWGSLSPEEALRREQPMEVAGYLVGPTQVVSTDPMIHPRFVESVTVSNGQDEVPAETVAYGRTQSAAVLDLARPLEGARPLTFPAEAGPPAFAVSYGPVSGRWTATVRGFAPAYRLNEDGRRSLMVPMHVLLTDAEGRPVGLSMNAEVPADDSWTGPPAEWPMHTADEVRAVVEATAERCRAGLLRTRLQLRSPRKKPGAAYRFRSDDADEATELYANSLLVGPDRVLVLANLKPKVTARLEGLTVYLEDGDEVPATFEASLTDYGCLTARLERSLPGAIPLSDRPAGTYRFALLPAAEVRMAGENRTVHYAHSRIVDLTRRWRERLYPMVAGRGEGLFLFDPAGAVVALPVAKRTKVQRQRWSSSEDPRLTAAADLHAVLADLPAHTDASNVPLSEEEENRLAWLGVILQPMNRELARANKVANLTEDGETGAIVSYVYPDSPATEAGVEAGDVLLHFTAEGQPEPVPVRIEDYGRRGPFPWDRLDELAEQYYDRISPPWPPVETPVTRALTDLGFGTTVEAHFVRNGEVMTKTFEVTAGPPHYGSAPRYTSEVLGLTVRDLTYDVRRYLQRGPEAPGVVISKIEPGSKASVAGIKPFELITHVNDEPVADVKAFEEAMGRAKEELRLSVKRMTQGRVVRIRLAPAAAEPSEEAPAEPSEEAPPAAP
jgi:hypothetical protein